MKKQAEVKSDGMDGTFGAAEGEGEEHVDPAPEPTPEPAEDVNAENARLKAEVAALRTVRVEVNQPTPVAQAPVFTREDLARRAVELGFTKNDDSGNVVADVEKLEAVSKIATAAAMPGWQKAQQLEQELQLERTMNRAKKEAQAKDSQFSKLEAHVDEYFDNVSTEDKLNPEKMKKHMEIAKTYAKGKIGVVAPSGRRVESPTPRVSEDEESTEGRVFDKPEVHTTKDGKIRMVSTPRVSQKVRERHAHPDYENGVQIDPTEEWSKKPTFGANR